MDLRKLEHFLAVLDHGHFGRAAEVNGVSQQAVSQAISKLEEELGVPLFERHAAGAAPTVYAELLRERARHMLAETRLAESEIQALSSAEEHTLRIGIGPNLVNRILPQVLREFRGRHPGAALAVSVDLSPRLYPQLLRGDLDLVASAPLNPQELTTGLVVETLFEEIDQLVVRASHPLAAKAAAPVELVRHPWVVPRLPPPVWERFCRMFLNAGTTPPRDVLQTDSAEVMRTLILADDFIGIAGREALHVERAGGAVVSVDAPEFAYPHPVLLAQRPKRLLPEAGRTFVEILRTTCRALA